MNQILSTQTPNNDSNYNNYRQDKTPGAKSLKKVIIFFSCAIIFIGLVIVAINLIKMNSNKQKSEITEIQVNIEELEDDTIKISVQYDLGINQIEYYFKEDDTTNLQVNGKTSIEKLIDKPNGAKKLTVKVTDQEGYEKEFIKEFEGGDTTRPTITAEPIIIEESTKLKIVAKDEEELSYLIYQWTGEEEQKIMPEEGNEGIIEINIDIERATKDITITAVDANGNIETITKTIVGKYVPEISVLQYGDKIECKITHDKGFEKIVFNINGQEMVYDKEKDIYDESLTEFVCSIPLKSGENKIIIQAYSLEGTEKTYKGICNNTQV